MKHIIIIISLFAVLISCRDDEEPIPSVTERVEEAKSDLIDDLTAPANGWKVEYKPNNQSGTFLILLDFRENGTVSIQSDVIAEEGEYLNSEITYRIDAGLNLELIFESYVVFHYLYDIGDGALEGEFEFIYERTEAERLIFRSKSDEIAQTEIVFEPASGNEASSFSTELFENIDAFGGDIPITIAELIFGVSLESPRQHVILEDQNISIFWAIDITGRFLTVEIVAEGTTEQEILANNNFQTLDHFTGYTFSDGNMIFNEPIPISLDGISFTISSIEVGEFSESGPELCIGTGTPTPRFNASSPSLGSINIEKTLLSSDASGVTRDGIYSVNAAFIFDADGDALTEEGSIAEKLPDAGGFYFFYEFENDTMPDNMMGFITVDSLENVKWIFNEINVTKTLNKLTVATTDQFFTLGDVTDQEKASTREVLDEIFSGGTYIYDFDYIDGLTIYWIYNPCNKYELLLVEN